MSDPICAPATPLLPSAVAVVRVSGPALAARLRSLVALPAPRVAALRTLAWDGYRERALVLFFPEPRSYTGEDLVEFQLHGNPLLVRRFLEHLGRIGRPSGRTGGIHPPRPAQRQAEPAGGGGPAGPGERRQRHPAAPGPGPGRRPAALGGPGPAGPGPLAGPGRGQRGLRRGRGHRPGPGRPEAGPGGPWRRCSTWNRPGPPAPAGCWTASGSPWWAGPTPARAPCSTPWPGPTGPSSPSCPAPPGMCWRCGPEWAGLPLYLFDTAGLRASEDPVERLGVARVRGVLEQVDLILHLVPLPDPAPDPEILERLAPFAGQGAHRPQPVRPGGRPCGRPGLSPSPGTWSPWPKPCATASWGTGPRRLPGRPGHPPPAGTAGRAGRPDGMAAAAWNPAAPPELAARPCRAPGACWPGSRARTGGKALDQVFSGFCLGK